MHAVTDSPATTNQEAPQACHGVGASTGNDDIACACKRGDGTQGEGQAARTPAPATHTRTRHAQPAESRVYGTRCLAAVAHQLKLPLDTRAIPPTSRRQEKKAEHSGQHDRRQRASQSTHARTQSSGATGGPAHTHCRSHPAALTPGLRAAADLAHRSSSRPARSTSKQGVMIQTAARPPQRTCHPRHTRENTLPHARAPHPGQRVYP